MKELIKHILKEETNHKTKIHKFIKNLGIKGTMKIAGGKDRFIKKMDIESPSDFLYLLNDMDTVQSEENPDWSLFRYKPKENIIVYDRKNHTVYISYDEIWSVLEFHFDLNYSEAQKLIKRWLDEIYNLKGGIIILPGGNFYQNVG